MARYHVNLPGAQMPANAMLDFSGLNSGIDAIGKRNEMDRLRTERAEERQYARGRNAMADQRYADETAYRRGRDALSDTRYSDELQYNRGRQGVADQRAAQEHGWRSEDRARETEKRLANDAASIFQNYIDNDPDPTSRAAKTRQFIGVHPKVAGMLTEQGVNLEDPAAVSQFIRAQAMEFQDPAATKESFGLSPIYGTDAQGNSVIMQVGSKGTVHRPAIPEGVTPLGPEQTAAARAQGGATGKHKGQAQAEIAGVVQNANQMLGHLTSLKTDPYLSRMLGPIDSRTPDLSADAGRVLSKMNQINGAAFLQAFESLKGGGQITEIEGLKATQAISRLTERNMDPADYVAAIEELEQIVRNGVIRARVDAGELPQSSLGELRNFGGEGTSTQPRARNPQTGEEIEWNGSTWVPVR